MNIFKINVIGGIFFILNAFMPVMAQNNGGQGHYYSNPKNGIKPTKIVPYTDTSVVAKSENITIEIQGEEGSETIPLDSIKGNFDSTGYYDYEYTARINRFHRNMGWDYYDDYYTNMYWYTHDPWMWGSSIYWGPAWGYYGYWGPYWGTGWSMTYGWDYWGWSPFWGVSYGWYLGNGWYARIGWGYDSFYSPYWGYGYPYYSGAYAMSGRGWGQNGWGHQYIGQDRSNGGRPNLAQQFGRGSSSSLPSRRGGVDINPNGRTSHGMTSSGRGSNSGSMSNTRYDKPARIADSRAAATSGRTSSSRSSYTAESRNDANSNYRSSASPNGGNTSSYRTGSTSSYRTGNSNGGSSYRSSSSSSSRGSSSYGGSSSRSSSSFSGSSRSSSSFGGSHSSSSSFGGSHSSSSSSRR